ncbi:MAG: GNAT family N-acetyltransferase [Pseudomonadota bacterium]
MLLRPLDPADAKTVQRLAGEREIAAMTQNIPHPYEDGLAEQWIAAQSKRFQAGTHTVFAITRRESSQFAGTIGLTIHREFERAELGYWVGKPYWGKGYATEAAARIVSYGFC